MFQKFRITFYSLIVLLVLVLPSQADAVELYADSCKGWDCSYEGQICPNGAEGASGSDFICRNSKWVKARAGFNGKALCRGFNRYPKPVGVILPEVLKSTEYWFRRCTTETSNKNGYHIQLSNEECLVKYDAQTRLLQQCE